MALADELCTACRPGSPTVTDAEAAALTPEIPEWGRVERGDIPRLQRRFKFKNFTQAMEFAVQVGEAADAEDHHPLITVEWGRALVAWWTHSIRGLHRNDFIMAGKTDAIYSKFGSGTGSAGA